MMTETAVSRDSTSMESLFNVFLEVVPRTHFPSMTPLPELGT